MEEKDFELFARRWVGPKEEFRLIVGGWWKETLNSHDVQRIHNPSAFSLRDLFGFLEDRDPYIRKAATEVLIYRREEEVYGALVRAVKKEKDWFIKDVIERVLKKRQEQARIDVIFRIPAEVARQMTQ